MKFSMNKKRKNNKKFDIDKIKNNKKIILIIVIVMILILLGGFLLVRGHHDKTDNMNDLDIHYSDDKLVSFDKFNKSFTYEKTITINNTSDEYRTYSLEWSNVSNTLKKQNGFTYEIKCTGERCATLAKSQVPITGAIVYPQCVIAGGKTQEYKIIFNYKGSDKGKFSGELKVYSEKIDKKKMKQEKKKIREEMRKKAKEDIKKESNA